MTTSGPRRVAVEDFRAPGDDRIPSAIREHAAAMNEVAAALLAVAGEIRNATAQRQAVDEFYAGATLRLDLLCRWLRVKGPWLLASTPVVLVAVQAISPEAGKALAALLQGLTR